MPGVSATAVSQKPVNPNTPVPPAILDRTIKAADPTQYMVVRDSADWKNPFLTVKREGIEIASQGVRRIVPLRELRQALVKLPVEAWPYGRVAGVATNSIVSEREESEALQRDFKAVRDVLAALKVDVNSWPS